MNDCLHPSVLKGDGRVSKPDLYVSHLFVLWVNLFRRVGLHITTFTHPSFRGETWQNGLKFVGSTWTRPFLTRSNPPILFRIKYGPTHKPPIFCGPTHKPPIFCGPTWPDPQSTHFFNFIFFPKKYLKTIWHYGKVC